jgi:hypothetical protein
MSPRDKPLAWLHGEVKTPPFSTAARLEAGHLLRLLQRGHLLSLPHSRPMPVIGPRCHELRVPDGRLTWRTIYRLDITTASDRRDAREEDGTDSRGGHRHVSHEVEGV